MEAARSSASKSEKVTKPKVFEGLDEKTICLFAESCGIAVPKVDDAVWTMLSGEVNFRVREVADLAAKWAKCSRRTTLTTDDFDRAAQHLYQMVSPSPRLLCDTMSI